MTTVPKKYMLNLRSDKCNEKTLGTSKKRYRDVSNDSGFSSQASSDDDGLFSTLDTSPEIGCDLNAVPPLALGPIAPPKFKKEKARVNKLDEVIAALKGEIEQLRPYTVTEATWEQFIVKYRSAKKSLDELVNMDNQGTLLDIKKTFVYATLVVRMQFLELTFLILNLAMQTRLSNVLRNQFGGLFCDVMKLAETILQTTLNYQQFNIILNSLHNGLFAFEQFCQTLDHYHYSTAIRQFVRSCYAYLSAAEESYCFATLRQTQIETVISLFNGITLMFNNFCQSFNLVDTDPTIAQIKNLRSNVGKFHPWELLRRLLAAIGTSLRMPEPVTSSKILLRLMVFVGHDASQPELSTHNHSHSKTRSSQHEELESPESCTTTDGGGFISTEDLLVHDVRINSGVHVPWRFFEAPTVHQAHYVRAFHEEHLKEQFVHVPTAIPSWYVKTAREAQNQPYTKKTKEKEMLKLRQTIAFPLSKARVPLITWPGAITMDDENCILFGNGLP